MGHTELAARTAAPDRGPDEALALCQTTRLSLAYFLGYLGQVRDGFGGDVLKGLVFVAIVQGNIGHLDNDADNSRRWAEVEAVPPDELRRPIRVLPLAESLRLPRESVRRKVKALAAEGFVRVGPEGVVAPTAVLSRPGNARAVRANAALVRELVSGLIGWGALGHEPPSGDPLQSRERLIARLSSSYCLRCLEEVRDLLGGQVITGLTFLALAHANLGGRGEGRRPVTAQALAGAVGLPRQTVRRHLKRLEDGGLCSHAGRAGFLILDQPMAHPALAAAARRNQANLRWLIGQLRRSGALQPGL
jgi:DNA-binding transcriptional ArsR family regulator